MQPCAHAAFCFLFFAVCTESDGKLNRGLAMRLQFCVSYLIDKATHVNVSARMCVVCTCMCGRGRSSTQLCLVCE